MPWWFPHPSLVSNLKLWGENAGAAGIEEVLELMWLVFFLFFRMDHGWLSESILFNFTLSPSCCSDLPMFQVLVGQNMSCSPSRSLPHQHHQHHRTPQRRFQRWRRRPVDIHGDLINGAAKNEGNKQLDNRLNRQTKGDDQWLPYNQDRSRRCFMKHC